MEKKAALITTDKDKRGVFMGYIDPKDQDKENIFAENVRMCVKWGASTKGVLGLAHTGPDSHCRITKASPSAFIKGVTAVFYLTPEAETAWKKEPWKDFE